MNRPRMLLPALLLITIVAVPFVAAQTSEQNGLSAYTRRVLQRAEDGIAAIGNNGTGKATDQSWLPYSTTKAAQTLDTKTIRTTVTQNFSHATACMAVDAALILHEMAKVQDLLKQANEAHKDVVVAQLNDLYAFLNDRLGILNWGGANPKYQDPTWSTPHTFDSEETRTTIEKEKLCPFNSKYLAVSRDDSSGCTSQALDEAIALLPEDDAGLKESYGKERDALAALERAWSDLGMQTKATQQWEGCEEAPPIYTWSSGFFWEYPGQEFSTLTHLIWNSELQRPAPGASGSSASSTSSSSSSVRSFLQLGEDLFTQDSISKTQAFSQAQAKGDLLIRGGILHVQETADAFAPLTQTIGDLSHLAHDKDTSVRSLRDMVQDFAYFLRRSCMNRPCNDRLDTILSTVATDACFPYTSGSADLPADATAQAIKDQAQALADACKQAAESK